MEEEELMAIKHLLEEMAAVAVAVPYAETRPRRFSPTSSGRRLPKCSSSDL
jgi:hypothetical protein